MSVTQSTITRGNLFMRFFSARAAARFIPVVAVAMMLPGVMPVAVAAKVCTLGPPEQGLSTAEDSLADCLARLRRYDGEADAQGRVYALFGNVTLAVDSEGSYRYYPDGDAWAQFAGAPGRASALLRSIKPPGAPATAQPEAPAPVATPLPEPELTLAEDLQPVPEAVPEPTMVDTAPAALPEVATPEPAATETESETLAPAPAAMQAEAPVPTPTLAIETTIAPVVVPEPPAAAAAAAPAEGAAVQAAVTRDGALVACQYQQNGSWRTSRHFDLQSCAAQVEAVFLSAGGQGVMNGYWNGTFISATSGGVYISRDGGGSWERLPR